MSPLYPPHELLDGRLLVREVSGLGEVELDRYKTGNRRLVLVVDADEVWSDPVCSYIFHEALNDDRGCLVFTTPSHAPALASDLTGAADRAGEWLRLPDVVVELVLVTPVPLYVAAFPLVAAGMRPPQAISEVQRATGIEFDLDAEVAVSVFETQLHGLRVWRVAREVAFEGRQRRRRRS